MRLMMLMLLFLLFIPVVFAKEGSIKLLALSELSNGSQSGVVTDLSLEIKSGSERVFLDTFPLTKITTQISVRFAQQIACRELDIDCEGHDFFYAIDALQGLVGGPSAGAAATLLTASLLSGADIDKTMTITGTINSGGLIGPVGGVKQKIEAASQNGIKTVLIPKGSRHFSEGNKTIDLVEFGQKQGLNVIEVATFGEAFEKFTGIKQKSDGQNLVIEEKYKNIMQKVAEDICNSTSVKFGVDISKLNKTKRVLISNISSQAKIAFDNGEYYSAASFCFRKNILLEQLFIDIDHPKPDFLLRNIKNSTNNLKIFAKNLSGKKLTTVTDLQTYMAVSERLFEASDALDKARSSLHSSIVESADYLVYAEGRFNSAVAWSRFFDSGDTRFVISQENLKQSCTNKISEAEERYSYVKSVLPVSLSETRRELDRAYVDLVNKTFVMCLYRASKAKASSDVILGVMGVDESQLDGVLKLKLDVAKKEIIKSQQKGIFPIIGYSYYEYANSLRNTDKPSALLFAEYALELTNLDIYFGRKNSVFLLPFSIDNETFFIFVFGVVAGFGIFEIYHVVQCRKSIKKPKKGTP